MAANTECFTNIMVGDQDTNVPFAQVSDDALNIQYRDRIDTGKRFIEQNE